MVLQRVPAPKESSGSSAASRSFSWRFDQSPSHRRVGRRGVGFFRLQLIDEGFDGSELIYQVAEVGLQGIELLVQVIQSLRERLDPETKKERVARL